MTVKWTKNAKINGYQVQYSTDQTFKGTKTVTIKKASTTNTTVKKLAKGKGYYVRVRTYQKVGSKTYYSAWSASKNVTIKKYSQGEIAVPRESPYLIVGRGILHRRRSENIQYREKSGIEELFFDTRLQTRNNLVKWEVCRGSLSAKLTKRIGKENETCKRN